MVNFYIYPNTKHKRRYVHEFKKSDQKKICDRMSEFHCALAGDESLSWFGFHIASYADLITKSDEEIKELSKKYHEFVMACCTAQELDTDGFDPYRRKVWGFTKRKPESMYRG